MPAGRPRTFSKEDALDRAMEVFWRKGYEGASLAALTAATGVNRPSLYAAFGDKQALFGAVLERYLEGPASFVGRALAEPTAERAVARLLRDAAHELTMPGRPPGCLAIHGALACGDEGAVVRSDLATRRRLSEAAIRARLERASDEGDLGAGVDPALLAKYVATVFQGLGVQAVGGASREELLAVADLTIAQLAL